MILNSYSESELRNASRETIETLEYWLRRVVDKTLSDSYGPEYLNFTDNNGNRIINKSIKDNIEKNFKKEENRYTRMIDASLLDSLIDIICNPNLYKNHFRQVFEDAFPEGNYEARTFMSRLISPRNNLSHANPISIRQVEQILCYSHDIIDSIKKYYYAKNQQMSYNVPRFIHFKDSFGNEKFFDQNTEGHPMVGFTQDQRYVLRPGDYLSIEIMVDESFKETEYSIFWRSTKKFPDFGNVKKISFKIEPHHVCESISFHCAIVSNKEWHRMREGYDDLLLIFYKVLPPLE